VDFDNSTVVAIFAGERPSGGYSVEVLEISNESAPGKPKLARLQYRVDSPAPHMAVIQALTYPYVIVRVAGRFETVEFDPPLARPSLR
jgi:hypothetical protein